MVLFDRVGRLKAGIPKIVSDQHNAQGIAVETGVIDPFYIGGCRFFNLIRDLRGIQPRAGTILHNTHRISQIHVGLDSGTYSKREASDRVVCVPILGFFFKQIRHAVMPLD